MRSVRTPPARLSTVIVGGERIRLSLSVSGKACSVQFFV